MSEEWNKVIENMQDPERPYKAKRKLVITLTCTQNEKRSAMDVEAEVKSTLAPISGVGTRFDTGRDSEGNSYLQDDGVSQRATVSRGAHGKTDVKVPSPVVLQPYRTFIDIEQPASPFINLRLARFYPCRAA